eukprot:7947626-Ditylum_brightwellii.AAC.1
MEKHVKAVELDKNYNMAKFRSAPGNTKSVVNCRLLEEQIGLLNQESTKMMDSPLKVIQHSFNADSG